MFSKKTDKPLCPLLNKPCIGKDCQWFTHIMGKHPQSGADMDMEDCAVKWLPVLLIETSKETRQLAAATESARNEDVVKGTQLINAIMQAAQSSAPALNMASDNKLLGAG